MFVVHALLALQQCALHVCAAHDTCVPQVFTPLHSRSHDVVALHVMPAAHAAPVVQSTRQMLPAHCTPPLPQTF